MFSLCYNKKGVIFMDMQHIMQTIDAKADDYLDFLCDICAFEARAKDKEELDRMADYIGQFAEGLGFTVERTAIEACGDFLCIDMNKGAPKGCVLLAHTDTVHDKGVFGANPVTRLEDRILAPGAIDCKGGIAIALLMMQALQNNGYDRHLRLLLTSDEEVSNVLGGTAEVQYFTEKVAGFPYAINCETSEKDEVVVSRKGICKYRIDIDGISGHSGIHYFECRNPIEEAAHKILALQSKSKPGGITYSCNIIHGGMVENIIPKTCSIWVDVRLPLRENLAEVEATMAEVVGRSFVEGTSATLTCISKRPPMERNQATDTLFEKLLGVCRKYGLGSLTPVESGGGSDSCYTQAAGIPSICGMGGCGAFCHTNQEYILNESVALRAKIIAAFLTEEY